MVVEVEEVSEEGKRREEKGIYFTYFTYKGKVHIDRQAVIP